MVPAFWPRRVLAHRGKFILYIVLVWNERGMVCHVMVYVCTILLSRQAGFGNCTTKPIVSQNPYPGRSSVFRRLVLVQVQVLHGKKNY